MGLHLTNAADYAIRAMIHMACVPEDSVVLRNDIARAQGVPPSFMAKVLRSLVRAQLLRSTRGVNGGFCLARSVSDITLLDVVQAIEGPLALTDCTDHGGCCDWAAECPASQVWATVQDRIAETLRSYTLEMLASCPRRNGKVVSIGRAS